MTAPWELQHTKQQLICRRNSARRFRTKGNWKGCFPVTKTTFAEGDGVGSWTVNRSTGKTTAASNPAAIKPGANSNRKRVLRHPLFSYLTTFERLLHPQFSQFHISTHPCGLIKIFKFSPLIFRPKSLFSFNSAFFSFNLAKKCTSFLHIWKILCNFVGDLVSHYLRPNRNSQVSDDRSDGNNRNREKNEEKDIITRLIFLTLKFSTWQLLLYINVTSGWWI